MMSRIRLILVVAVALLAVATAVGCSKAEPPKAEPTWPQATAERPGQKPAEPARWPLTGLVAPDELSITKRIVSVKIENSPSARPQSGLDKADVVYETVTEGGITRFNAMFQSQEPDVVGPVRSARPSDLYVVPQYKALFAHVGGDTTTLNRLRNKRYSDMDEFGNPTPYWRAGDRPAPHNLYMSVPRLRAVAIDRRHYAANAIVKPFSFDKSGRVTTPTVSGVVVPFSPDNKVRWTYDPASRNYLRSINERAHTDRASGKQYAARNVVILWAQTNRLRRRDSAGSETFEIVLQGSGRATVLRDGQRVDGTWRTDGTAPPVFKEPDGKVIRFAPGITWFQVIANSQDIILQ